MNSVNSAIPLTNIYIYIYIYMCVCVPYRYNIHNYPFRYWRYVMRYMMEMISGRHNNKAGRS